jgi:hypothetical protein
MPWPPLHSGCGNDACEGDCSPRCLTKGQKSSLQIANDGGEGRAFGHFMPRSTAKRAAAFGRQVRMERQGMEDPAVVINIPL